MGKVVFLIGGARSGKSEYSEKLASLLSDRVAYIATSEVTDVEMEKRIEIHKKRRPKNWKTYEISENDIGIQGFKNIFNQITRQKIDVILIDCITNLLFRIIYKYHLENIEVIRNEVEKVVEKEVALFFDGFLKIIKESGLNIIIVSNEVGSGVVPYYPLGRIFRDLMGAVNKKIAACSDEVYFFVAGLKQKLK